MKLFVEDIFGLKNERAESTGKLDGVIQLLIDIRKEAKTRKDFVTSDKIRNELAALGVQLKDEKDGGMSEQIYYNATMLQNIKRVILPLF
jgi:cysteinyl-tRNA synthetase